jgi:hypothetical protein
LAFWNGTKRTRLGLNGRCRPKPPKDHAHFIETVATPGPQVIGAACAICGERTTK